MSATTFNRIVILDAIPSDEYQSGRAILNELHDLRDYQEVAIESVRYEIADKTMLIDAFKILHDQCLNEGVRPLIHLIAHGFDDESGFVTPDGGPVFWNEFLELITPLNIALKLGLFVISTACFGASVVAATSPSERAPFRFLIGPRGTITAGQVQELLVEFYRAFFTEGEMRSPLKALANNRYGVEIYYTTAEKFFNEVWVSYLEIQCKGKNLKNRVREIHRELKLKGVSRSMSEIKKDITGSEQRQFYIQSASHYFMYDLYSDHRYLFGFDYKALLRLVQEFRSKQL